MTRFQMFKVWFRVYTGRAAKFITCIICIAVVLLVLRLLVEWHADFLYNYFMRRMYEDFFSSKHPQEMMLMLMQALSH